MAPTPALRLTRLFLVALVALGLVASAQAHRMPVSPDMLAFLQATGASADDLCGSPVSQGGERQPCKACQIAAFLPVGPAPAKALHMNLVPGGAVLPVAATDLAALPHDPAHPPRAPPVG